MFYFNFRSGQGLLSWLILISAAVVSAFIALWPVFHWLQDSNVLNTLAFRFQAAQNPQNVALVRNVSTGCMLIASVSGGLGLLFLASWITASKKPEASQRLRLSAICIGIAAVGLPIGRLAADAIIASNFSRPIPPLPVAHWLGGLLLAIVAVAIYRSAQSARELSEVHAELEKFV